jgi:hypothetical protein
MTSIPPRDGETLGTIPRDGGCELGFLPGGLMVVCEAGGGRIHSGPMWIDWVVAICNIWSTIGEIVMVVW